MMDIVICVGSLDLRVVRGCRHIANVNRDQRQVIMAFQRLIEANVSSGKLKLDKAI
jgi:hypothetical protein